MKIQVKHKAAWYVCAAILVIEVAMIAGRTHKACAGIGCDPQFGLPSLTANLTSPTPGAIFNSGDVIAFTSSHSASITRTDCPNSCGADVTANFSNGFDSTTIASGSCTMSWGKGTCGTQSCSGTISQSTAIISPGPTTYDAFAKTVCAGGIFKDDFSFTVN